MTLPVKLGLAALGTAGVATSAYYGGSFLMGKKESDMPLWRPLVQDTEFLNSSGATTQPKNEFSGKYGADKARLLVGTGVNVVSAKPESNQDWWNWVFRSKYDNRREEFKGGFKDLKRGSKGDPSGKSIQEACDTVYKSNTDKIKSKSQTLTANDASEFKEEQVWVLCSALGSKPKTLAEAESANSTEDNQKLTSDWQSKLGATKKTDLLAIFDGGNAKAWSEINGQYQLERPNSGFFKLEDSSSARNIRDRCEAAYKLDSAGTDASDNSKPTEADLYKWCSLKGYKP